MPVVLIPVHFDRDPAARIPSCSRSIVLRPFLSSDFMTGVPILPGSERLPLNVSILAMIITIMIPAAFCPKVLDKMVRDISEINGISRILYDLTAKPPGTTEWE